MRLHELACGKQVSVMTAPERGGVLVGAPLDRLCASVRGWTSAVVAFFFVLPVASTLDASRLLLPRVTSLFVQAPPPSAPLH